MYNTTEFRPGDIVTSLPNNDYRNLIGTVLKVNLVGSPEHNEETENETDDVHVNFRREDYSPQRITEIEAMFTKLRGTATPFDELPLDDVIMAPSHLLRLADVDDERFYVLANGLVNGNV